jgi:hypothetical protein
MRRLVVGLAVLALAGSAAGADLRPTVLPRPAFAPPVADVRPSGELRLGLVSSRAREPGPGAGWPAAPAWAPESFAGKPLLTAIRQAGKIFLVYGPDFASARYLVAADPRTGRLRYAFDFVNYAYAPEIAPGDREFVYEQPVWAREADGVLYVETAHMTYARSSGNRNAYVTAIDLRTRKVLWQSPALVANARTFVLAGETIVTGYGFTAEPDFLYLLDRRTGRVLDRLAVPTGPETIALHGDRLTVRTYDHEVVAELRPG